MPFLASWFLASYHRSVYLRATLESIERNRVPDGWTTEVVVCAPPEDDVPDQVGDLAIRRVTAPRTDVGSQTQAAFEATRGQVVLRCGDDDLQSPHRLSEALALHESGARVVGCDRALLLQLATGVLAKIEMTPWLVGGLASYQRDVLEATGWEPCERGADGQLWKKLEAQGVGIDALLPPLVGEETIALTHSRNVSAHRHRYPPLGVTVEKGPGKLTTIGDVEDIPSCHLTVARALVEREQTTLRLASEWRESYGVTCVIPTRDSDPDQLRRAVQSALAHPVEEVVVVVDTHQVWTPVRDSRVRVLRSVGGISAALNAGAYAARTTRLAFLDADDSWTEAKSVQLATPGDALYSDYAIDGEPRILDGRDPRDVYQDNLWPRSSTVIARRLLLDVGGFDEGLPYCQDWDLHCLIETVSDWQHVPVVTVECGPGRHTATARIDDSARLLRQRCRVGVCRRWIDGARVKSWRG